MKLATLLLLATLSVFCANAQLADTLTNEKIIKLFKAGFSNDVLKSKIAASVSKFDVSIDGLISLKKAGISDDVINRMIAKPEQFNNTATANTNIQTNPQGRLNLESGIYYKTFKEEYLEIEPSVLSSTKSNNAAQYFISGLINSKLKVSISDKQSSFQINEYSPKFIFVFDTTQKNNLNNDNNQWFTNARSPKEFLLVRLDVTSNSREITVGKSNAVGENMGINEKSVMRFTSKKCYNGTYEIMPELPLADGEYCIMFSQGIKKGQSTKVFDFSIKSKKAF
jgi:hypothetical protein